MSGKTHNSEDIELQIAGLLLLEAVGLEFAHTETLGAVIALFAAVVIATVLRRLNSESG
jgi:threonine/homoserine efflux transporter RhtA